MQAKKKKSFQYAAHYKPGNCKLKTSYKKGPKGIVAVEDDDNGDGCCDGGAPCHRVGCSIF